MSGTIVLTEGLELSEVVVTAPIKEGGTGGRHFSPSSMPMPTGSKRLELGRAGKKIPGLEYDRQNKTLVYNGLPIAEINVNGEAFFAGNHALALENLPADLVSRIKVYDKRSEMEKFMGIKTGKKTMCSTCKPRRSSTVHLVTSVTASRGNSKEKKRTEIKPVSSNKPAENLSVIAKSGNFAT